MSFFRAEDISVSFGGVRAVHDVSFEVNEHELFAIMGPNGAGKTTVLNLISRFYDLDAGKMWFEDKDISTIRTHKVAAHGIARTFQNTELFQKETVLDNLLIARHLHAESSFFSELGFLPKVKRQEQEFRKRAEDIIDLLDLQGYRNARIESLPFGIRKITEIARALSLEPKLLLMDEPSSGLNPEETEDLAFWIEDIKDGLGISIIMVEHDMNLLSTVSDRVLVMADGELLTIGTPDEVTNHPDVVSAYLGE